MQIGEGGGGEEGLDAAQSEPLSSQPHVAPRATRQMGAKKKENSLCVRMRSLVPPRHCVASVLPPKDAVRAAPSHNVVPLALVRWACTHHAHAVAIIKIWHLADAFLFALPLPSLLARTCCTRALPALHATASSRPPSPIQCQPTARRSWRAPIRKARQRDQPNRRNRPARAQKRSRQAPPTHRSSRRGPTDHVIAVARLIPCGAPSLRRCGTLLRRVTPSRSRQTPTTSP